MIDRVDPDQPAGAVKTTEGYGREESRSHQLDRNWAELLQELRVIGTGVQILFAFLLSIAFQARFSATTDFERAVYVATLLLAGLSTALMITPVAVHRFTFRERVKDELVAITNVLAIAGLVVLSLAMTGSVLLICDWVAGAWTAAVCTAGTVVVFGTAWLGFPWWLRQRALKDARRS
ncbi:MAG: DUF6328 family protein [Actinomycetota bacterium]|nr:DUF6328 family protein [Actinomycetota bacterium]